MNELAAVVNNLVEFALTLSEADLERPWKWGSYDSEGVRFAFFRMQEELRALAVQVGAARQTAGRPLSQAQHILAQGHAAFRDVQAAVAGLDEAVLNQAPAEGEWPVRRTLAHIVQADLGFQAGLRYALECHRSGSDCPKRVPDDAWESLVGLNDAEYDNLMNGSASAILAFYEQQHARNQAAFAGIRDEELDLLSYYWEDKPLSLRFRLGRFESHARQHTIQIDKTLAALGLAPAEPRRLLRLVVAALAEAEGAQIGAADLEAEPSQAVACTLRGWINEISQASSR